MLLLGVIFLGVVTCCCVIGRWVGENEENANPVGLTACPPRNAGLGRGRVRMEVARRQQRRPYPMVLP